MGWEDIAGPLVGGTAGFFVGGPAGAAAGAGMGMNWAAQRDANSANRAIASSQIDFQRDMSNTAHQREVLDLQKAGLNPILSAGGNGSSTPAGASPTMVAPQIDFPAFLQVKQLEQQDQRIQIEKANSAAGIAKTLSDTELTKMKKILAQKGMIKAEIEGEAAGILQKGIKKLKNYINTNKPPDQNTPFEKLP